MSREVPSVSLEGPLDLELANGSTVRVRPGPYGKGIAVVHVRISNAPTTASSGEPTGGPGRKPRQSTLRLRDLLLKDFQENAMKDNPQYVRWLMDLDAHVNIAVARQTVYRERKRIEQP